MEKITLNRRLNKIQSEIKAPKNQYNTFGGYNYRSCEDILSAVKPLLEECILTLSDEITMIGDRYYIKATATIEQDNEKIATVAYAREPLIKKGMDESQITGTASSYARKYALNGLFLIDDIRDTDTMDNTQTGYQTHTNPVQQKQPEKQPANPNSLGEYVVNFGKHKGKTFKTISKDDAISYATFLAGKIIDPGSPAHTFVKAVDLAYGTNYISSQDKVNAAVEEAKTIF